MARHQGPHATGSSWQRAPKDKRCSLQPAADRRGAGRGSTGKAAFSLLEKTAEPPRELSLLSSAPGSQGDCEVRPTSVNFWRRAAWARLPPSACAVVARRVLPPRRLGGSVRSRRSTTLLRYQREEESRAEGHVQCVLLNNLRVSCGRHNPSPLNVTNI